MIWPYFRKIKTRYVQDSFSLAIELNQLLNNRITDIDDLFTNTLGAIIGYLLYRALKMIFKEGKSLIQLFSSYKIRGYFLFSMFICRSDVNLSSSFIWKTCHHSVRQLRISFECSVIFQFAKSL